MTWIMYAVLPTLIDVIIVKHKRNKTIKKIKEKLDEKGYIVDEKAKKRIPKFVIKNYFKEDYAKSDRALDISLSYLPIIRLLLIFSNISYLCGNYEGDNKIYKVLEDIASESDDLIRILEKNKYISADKEKQQWINDRNNALKELTGKSEDIAELENKYDKVNDYTKLNISNDIDMLKEKRKMLDEMIELKKSQKENDNILEKEIKKQNNDVELDNLSLKYTPDKKKKN